MAQVNPRTFADADRLGDQVYELILTNWGNRGQRQDPNNGSISYPPVKTITAPAAAAGSIPIIGEFLLPTIPSLSAIAIAPRSMVDRCILSLPTLTQLPAEATTAPPVTTTANGANAPLNVPIDRGFVNNGGILETEQILAVGAPLIGQQQGPIIIRACPEHWYSDTFVQDPTSPATGATGTKFGTALPTGPNNGGPIWVNPELRLLLYLTGKGALPPIARAPWNHTFEALNPGIGAGLSGQVLVKVVPVMGRKQIIVTAKNGTIGGAKNPTTLTLTGTFTKVSPAGASPFSASVANHEVPLRDPVDLPELEGAEVTVECGSSGVSYLLIYVSNADPSFIDISVTLY